MADTYITATYVKGALGTGLYNALDGVTGFSWTQLREGATASIQVAMRNSGYSPGTTTTNQYVMMATMGQLWEMASSLPEKNIPLPENWDTNPYNLARIAILNGDADLGDAITKIRAVGGWKFSDHSSASTGRQQRSGRSDLEDW